jgi:hypothetical protein
MVIKQTMDLNKGRFIDAALSKAGSLHLVVTLCKGGT